MVLCIIAVLFLVLVFLQQPMVNESPVAVYAYSPLDPIENDVVTFNASASFDPDGRIVNYKWDVGDGNIVTATEPLITHSYSSNGNYTVTLNVTDDAGWTSTCKSVVRVMGPAILRVSLPDGVKIGPNADHWLNEGCLLKLAGNTWSFLLNISDVSNHLTVNDTHVIIALNDAAYSNLENLTMNGTDIPKSSFKYEKPKPSGVKEWPDCVYPTWFSDEYCNIGMLQPKTFKIVNITATFTNATEARIHLDAHGEISSPPTNPCRIAWSPNSEDSTVMASTGTPSIACNLEIEKSGPNYTYVGCIVTYRYTVTNCGPCSAEGVQVTDNIAGNATYVKGDTDGDGRLDHGETWTFTADYLVQDSDPDQLENAATASSKTFDRDLSDNNDTWVVSVLRPGITVTKTGPSSAKEGEVVTYTLNVTNIGNCQLFNVSLNDSLLGSFDVGNLTAGEFRTINYNYTVPAGIAQINNTVTVSGKDILGSEFCSKTSWTVQVIPLLEPAIEVTKTGPAYSHEGEVVVYSIIINNTGNCALHNITAIDTLLGNLAAYMPKNTLGAGETVTFNVTYQVPAQSSEIANAINVSGEDPAGHEVSDTASCFVTILHPAISVTKQGPEFAHENDTVTYHITVENIGDCSLSNIQVIDSLSGTIYSGELLAGEIREFTVEYDIPTSTGSLLNTVAASGTDIIGLTVSDSASWTTRVIHPAIEVTKTAPQEAYINDQITYKFVISNTGDCDLTGVSVTDSLFGVLYNGNLAAGEIQTVEMPYKIPTSSGSLITNTVIAEGTDQLGLQVKCEDTHTLNVLRRPTPVGGYTISTNKHTAAESAMHSYVFVAALASLFTIYRRRRLKARAK